MSSGGRNLWSIIYNQTGQAVGERFAFDAVVRNRVAKQVVVVAGNQRNRSRHLESLAQEINDQRKRIYRLGHQQGSRQVRRGEQLVDFRQKVGAVPLCRTLRPARPGSPARGASGPRIPASQARSPATPGWGTTEAMQRCPLARRSPAAWR